VTMDKLALIDSINTEHVFIRYKFTRVNLSMVSRFFREGRLIIFSTILEYPSYHWKFETEEQAIKIETWLDRFCFDVSVLIKE